MIHRAPFGSLERFIALLIEHTAGKFPLWLAPDQIIILPISQKYNEYCIKLLKLLKNSDIRGQVDDRNETTGKKIREAELSKIPYMIIVGEKEIQSSMLSIRKHGGENLGAMDINNLILFIKEQINSELKGN